MKRDKLSLLFLLISHNNSDEVNDFVDHIKTLQNESNISIAVGITDNFGNFELPDNNSGNELDVFVVRFTENLGYLAGCNAALQQFANTHEKHPDWIAISNTDLILPNDLLSMFKVNSINLGQLSTRVITKEGVQQNPHLLVRPTKIFYYKQAIVHLSSWIGALYILASSFKARLVSKKLVRGTPSETKEVDLFAAHGSIFFLSKMFFDKGGVISNGPFLYGEELYIGEQLSKLGLVSRCITNLRVIHNAHSSTKFVSLRNKSKMIRNSNSMIFKKFRNN